MLIGAASFSSLAAQELPRSFASLRYVPAGDSVAHLTIPGGLVDSTARETYWVEGALIGGVPLALLGALAAGMACDPDSGAGEGPCWDNELLGLGFGFATGASLGALIGGQIKKGRKDRNQPGQEIEPIRQDSSKSTTQ